MPKTTAERTTQKKTASVGSLKGYLPKNAMVMAKKKSAPAIAVEPLPNFKSLSAIADVLHDCTRCKLSKGRTHVVVGEGNPRPELMFVGEGPGATEDLQGRPFVGRSGKLLDKMIEAMGVQRSDVFIANIVKCRPPENRAPDAEEVATCTPFLAAQIKMLKPKMIVALGATSAKHLLATNEAIGDLRKKIHTYENTPLVATYHPAYLLRNPPAKKDCWEDLQMVMKELGWKAPKKGKV